MAVATRIYRKKFLGFFLKTFKKPEISM
jgi:hypothetical protein